MNLAAASLTEQVINEVSDEVGRRGSEEQLLEMQQGFHLQEELLYELSEILAICEHCFHKLEAGVLVSMAKGAAKELTQLREQVAVSSFMLFTLSLPTSPLHSFLLSTLSNVPVLILADQGG